MRCRGTSFISLAIRSSTTDRRRRIGDVETLKKKERILTSAGLDEITTRWLSGPIRRYAEDVTCDRSRCSLSDWEDPAQRVRTAAHAPLPDRGNFLAWVGTHCDDGVAVVSMLPDQVISTVGVALKVVASIADASRARKYTGQD